MAIAINLRSDHFSAAEIERLWDQVAAFEDAPSMGELGYRPHVTFAIYESPEIDADTAWSAMREAAQGGAALEVQFSRIRWFSHPQFVLWAEPAMNETLFRWHASIAAAINPAHCRPHYRPGAWVPHCTLGTRILDDRRDDAMAFARSFDRRFTVVFDVIDCVVFPPVQIVAERKLA
ncbi:MAG: 2'-5' RNA ligase family protein [Bradyrhizobium sp.]